MEDRRLTLRNLKLALDALWCNHSGDIAHLYYNRLLDIEARSIGQRLSDEWYRVGIDVRFEYHKKSDDEMPPGYNKELDAMLYFPWAVEHNGARVERDGAYDVAREIERINDCGNACAHVEPYGWVPEAGCPIHDGED